LKLNFIWQIPTNKIGKTKKTFHNFILKIMKIISSHQYLLVRLVGEEKIINLPGYPSYPSSEDVYAQGKEEKEINPEEISEIKESTEVNLNDNQPGKDLDVPGSELDDNEEKTGNEDEENNYYSIGGDDHDNLEEDLKN